MTPADFRLYDLLENLRFASGHDGQAAVDAWRAARDAAAAMQPDGELRLALGYLFSAADPIRSGAVPEGPLHAALDIAALAVLLAMDGSRNGVVQANADAAIAAEPLRPALRAALSVIRAQTCRMAQAAEVRS